MQLAAAQRFNDAEATWRHRIEQEQAATKAALQSAHVIAIDLQRSKAALDSTLVSLQHVEADRLLLTEKMRLRELEENERTQHKLRDLHGKMDEYAGEREANMQILIMKDEDNQRLRSEVESLRFQVHLLPPFSNCYQTTLTTHAHQPTFIHCISYMPLYFLYVIVFLICTSSVAAPALDKQQRHQRFCREQHTGS